VNKNKTTPLRSSKRRYKEENKFILKDAEEEERESWSELGG
jgi:hypothetical protein